MSLFLLDTDTITLAQFGHAAVVAQLGKQLLGVGRIANPSYVTRSMSLVRFGNLTYVQFQTPAGKPATARNDFQPFSECSIRAGQGVLPQMAKGAIWPSGVRCW